MSFTILGPLAEGGAALPLCAFKVPAGFPSPAADHIERQISLDELLNIRAPHVYLVSIQGDSMQGLGYSTVTWPWWIAPGAAARAHRRRPAEQ